MLDNFGNLWVSGEDTDELVSEYHQEKHLDRSDADRGELGNSVVCHGKIGPLFTNTLAKHD